MTSNQPRSTGHDSCGGVIDPSFSGALAEASDCVAIAADAGRLLHRRFGDPGVVAAKGASSDSGRVWDVVTEVDTACEERIVQSIRELSPNASILAEESGVSSHASSANLAASDDLWVVDPLDGTLNFAAGIPMFAVSIARYQQGALTAGVIHAPILCETWTIDSTGPRCNGVPIHCSGAVRAHETVLAASGSGQSLPGLARAFRSWRRVGSAALSLAWVAGGRFGAYVQTGMLQPWDLAVGAPLVQAAGGEVRRIDLEPWEFDINQPTGMVASAASISDEVLTVVRSAFDTMQVHE